MSCNNTWNTVNCSTHDFYDEDVSSYGITLGIQKIILISFFSKEEELFPHATVEFFR